MSTRGFRVRLAGLLAITALPVGMLAAPPAGASVPAVDPAGPVVTIDDGGGVVPTGLGIPAGYRPTVTYTGTWTHQVNVPGNLNATASVTSVVGSSVDVRFFGTSIAWYGAKESWLGATTVSLDGVAQGTVSQYLRSGVGDLAQALLFSRTALAMGWHHLRLVKANPVGQTQVDAFTYTGFVPTGSYSTLAADGRPNTAAFVFGGATWHVDLLATDPPIAGMLTWNAGTLVLPFAGRHVQVLGYAKGGTADVYLDGSLVGGFTELGAFPALPQVYWEGDAATSGRHTLTIVSIDPPYVAFPVSISSVRVS